MHSQLEGHMASEQNTRSLTAFCMACTAQGMKLDSIQTHFVCGLHTSFLRERL